MRFRILSAALAAAGLMSCASQAAADGFILTYQGTVSYGSDDTNIFGLGAGANLAGQAITESFVVDYAGGGNHDISGAPYFRSTIGGAGFMTSSVTINGVTTSVGSDTGLDDRTDQHLNPGCGSCNSSFSESTEDESFVNTGDLHESWITFGDDLGRGLNYHPSLALGPPVFTAADNLDLEGTFTISHELDNQTAGTVVFNYQTTATFTPDVVTITTFGVPEPAAWALMLVGFGATGAALRRRRSATALA
ncbi:MAG TPA: PEPxxWA-CTERM sorting domain-containing protein [Phenylobacterium sp.]|jgi:hypothetical protein|uniref:PEPxxWA-CTERM sorting domain-containing protein n=1 Tax=Phenylobacterium sp. TaxID=1871053 RepID=UPI002D0434D7|nr:PEPxxWA-CTERM sorting domain-containing protein [Phenylobacterium sp.]HXA40508.1 PEPxxWA-CTERM sorting domain-containing protein [Phenylobacterium sp.]